MIVVLHLDVKASKIKAIENVVFLHLTEIFISFVREEPRNPLLGTQERLVNEAAMHNERNYKFVGSV